MVINTYIIYESLEGLLCYKIIVGVGIPVSLRHNGLSMVRIRGSSSMTIAAYHVPNAVHPLKGPAPVEGLLFLLIKNLGVVDSIYQRAALFPEKQDIKVGVKTKHDSISMEEFPEITNKPMNGESAKGDKGSGKDNPAKSDLNPKHLICLMKHPSQHAPCIPVQL